jgi:hypothetical protein
MTWATVKKATRHGAGTEPIGARADRVRRRQSRWRGSHRGGHGTTDEEAGAAAAEGEEAACVLSI